jgi:hypothetical protein
MMMRVSSRGRAWFAVAVIAAVGLAVVGVSRVVATGDDQAQVVHGSATTPGWMRLEYRNVQVSIPDDWHRRTSGACAQAVEHWGPPTTASCGSLAGVSFLDSETFDAAGEPGVVTPGLDAAGPSWVGYVRFDDVVVSVGDDDRAVVERAIESVSMEGFQPVE